MDMLILEICNTTWDYHHVSSNWTLHLSQMFEALIAVQCSTYTSTEFILLRPKDCSCKDQNRKKCCYNNEQKICWRFPITSRLMQWHWQWLLKVIVRFHCYFQHKIMILCSTLYRFYIQHHHLLLLDTLL